ncbi:MAG: four helix bundle protein [Bdellovibrionota bacterium]
MLKNFQAYELALTLYKQCEKLKAKRHLKDQLDRASLSVVLNLSEGSAKTTQPEQRRFYAIALGSLRETQSILQILDQKEVFSIADRLGAIVYRLVHPR